MKSNEKKTSTEVSFSTVKVYLFFLNFFFFVYLLFLICLFRKKTYLKNIRVIFLIENIVMLTILWHILSTHYCLRYHKNPLNSQNLRSYSKQTKF